LVRATGYDNILYKRRARVPAGRCRPRVGFVCGWHRGDDGPARLPSSRGNNISSPRFPGNARAATSPAPILSTPSAPPNPPVGPIIRSAFCDLYFFLLCPLGQPRRTHDTHVKRDYHCAYNTKVPRNVPVHYYYITRYVGIYLYGTRVYPCVPAARVIESISLEKKIDRQFLFYDISSPNLFGPSRCQSCDISLYYYYKFLYWNDASTECRFTHSDAFVLFFFKRPFR